MARFILFPLLVAALLAHQQHFIRHGEPALGALTHKAMTQVCKAISVAKRVAAWTLETDKRLAGELADVENQLRRVQIAVENGTWQGEGIQCLSGKDEIEKVRTGLAKSKKAFEEVRKKGYLASTAAGISAGRMEEFLAVFVRASGSATSLCAQNSQANGALKGDDLAECVASAAQDRIPKEADLIHPPESLPEVGQRSDFENQIKAFLGGSDGTGMMVESSHCRLTSGHATNGVVATQAINQQILWGGGVFRAGSADTSSSTLTMGDTETTTHTRWTQNPFEGVEHLKRTKRALDDHEGSLETLEQDIKKLRTTLLSCLPQGKTGGPTPEEAFAEHHQNLLDAKNNLNAELEKLKGEILGNQTQKQNSFNPNDKATAQEPSAVNAVALPRFILPWIFLI